MGSGNSMGGMSDVLRIQMEKVELENTLASLLSQRKTAEAAFNTLLNQSLATPISVPDSLERLPLSWSESMALDSVISNNHAGGGRKRLPGQGGDGQENELPHARYRPPVFLDREETGGYVYGLYVRYERKGYVHAHAKDQPSYLP